MLRINWHPSGRISVGGWRCAGERKGNNIGGVHHARVPARVCSIVPRLVRVSAGLWMCERVRVRECGFQHAWAMLRHATRPLRSKLAPEGCVLRKGDRRRDRRCVCAPSMCVRMGMCAQPSQRVRGKKRLNERRGKLSKGDRGRGETVNRPRGTYYEFRKGNCAGSQRSRPTSPAKHKRPFPTTGFFLPFCLSTKLFSPNWP